MRAAAGFADRLWLWAASDIRPSGGVQERRCSRELARADQRGPGQGVADPGPGPSSKCTEFFTPLEIWGWPYIEGLGEDVVVLFYQAGGTGRYRMWYGTEGRRALYATMIGAESRGVPSGVSVMDSPRYR
jgi:hypothetical protein